MKNSEVNIRDPFVLEQDGVYYMYGTRAENFGKGTGGFDVYTSRDLENWSEPQECFDSAKFNMNKDVNWAPEVHEYNGRYYMFATFTNERRGTYILVSDSPLGPFVPHSDGAVTPVEWECLDGTLYVENGVPYIVFCHEHTQILNGTVCYAELDRDFSRRVSEPITLFSAADPDWVEKVEDGVHYITDGPFMFRTKNGELLMIWSTFINGRYSECVVRFEGGTIKGKSEHLKPLIDDDGGHGMIFSFGGKLMLSLHTPNKCGFERPAFIEISDEGCSLKTVK